MGGCRCTYRNCTIKSDGQTHMFHYPVFDKVRCHQWLKNAQRLDFLNLKVSQLKNRVVCQHHFKPDDFMNYKMDKLRFYAVPTENGPFCDAQDCPQTEPQLFEISLDDIESEALTHKDKKANFSVKYGDFLTNSELMFGPGVQLFPPNKLSLPSEVKKPQGQPVQVVEPNSDNNNSQFEESNRDVVQNASNKMDYDQIILKVGLPIVEKNEEINVLSRERKKSPVSKKNKSSIKILSEKKISAPVKVKGKLEPVSPSCVVSARGINTDNKAIINVEDKLENMEVLIYNPPESTKDQLPVTYADSTSGTLMETNFTFLQVPSVNQNYESNITNYEPITKLKISDIQQISSISSTAPNELIINTENMKSPEKSVTNKINQTAKVSVLPPERVAAIEEKRNFNKKLRDMIEFCLDDSDKQLNVRDVKKSIQENVTKKSLRGEIEKEKGSESVALHLSQDSTLPPEREYNLAFIETRIQRMEQLLLRKIEQNSQRILDLKDTFLQASVSDKKSVMTQTNPENEVSHKRKLFNDIRPYLSTDATSLLYEELFINESVKSETDKLGLLSKRRRCRR